MVRVFANGLGDLGSIPGRVIPKIQKMVFDSSLLNTQHYKVRIKDKMGQIMGKEWRLPLHLGGHPRLRSPTLLTINHLFAQLNSFKYSYLTLIILFNIDHYIAYS